jgi:hypothetical protein
MEKVKVKRLLFDTTEDLHKEIKAKAVFRGMSIKDYIIRAILRQMQEDLKYE